MSAFVPGQRVTWKRGEYRDGGEPAKDVPCTFISYPKRPGGLCEVRSPWGVRHVAAAKLVAESETTAHA